MTLSEEVQAEIRRLFYAEHWKVGTIATQLGVHHEAVRRVIESHRFANTGKPRYSELDPYLDFVRRTLERYPRLTATRLYEMLRLRGYPGSVVQLRRRLRQLAMRPQPKAEPYLRLSTWPGEQGQVDWGYFGKLRVGRAERKLWLLVVTLSWSRGFHVFPSFEQGVAAVLRGHVESFETLQGVPRKLLYDNMKTVVLERVGDAIRYHPRFLELCAHYLFAAYPCNPGQAHEKGIVERRIRDLRSSFFAARSFADLDDLRAQFAQWRDEVAYQRPCPAEPELTVGEALERERESLLALPEHPLETDELRSVVARKQPYVRFATNRYSIPHTLVGTALTLAADERRVRLLDGEQVVAEHVRCWERNQVVEQPEHVRGLEQYKRKARALRGRERLLSLIPTAEPLFTALAERNEPLGTQTAKLLKLLEQYGTEALAGAIDEAVQRETPRADSVAHILDRRRRDEGLPPALALTLPDRPSVRNLKLPLPDLEAYDELTRDDDETP